MSGVLGRLKYYLIGVILGVIAVYFMFGNRDFQCSYFPNDRVLNDLRSKELVFSETAECTKTCLKLDSNDVHQILVAGAVSFNESEPRKEPCGEYELVTKLPDDREIRARFLNCDSTATVLWFKKEGTDCGCE